MKRLCEQRPQELCALIRQQREEDREAKFARKFKVVL